MNTKISACKVVSLCLMAVLVFSSLVSNGKVNANSATGHVGFITDTAGVNDDGWNELAYQGLLRAQSILGIAGTVYESTSEADFLVKLNQCAADGNGLCIGANWMLFDAIQTAAVTNPTVKFALLDSGFESPPSNLRGIQFNEKEVGYLAGSLAGKMTVSNKIGAVGGMDIEPVVNFLEGYENGAQCANDKVIVLEKYTQTFTDPAVGCHDRRRYDLPGSGRNLCRRWTNRKWGDPLRCTSG